MSVQVKLGRGVQSWLLLALLLAPLACRTGLAQARVLPHATVQVDGQPADIGPVAIVLNSYLVPLDKAVAALTHGGATLDTSEPQFVKVMAGDRMIARLPADDAAGFYADVAGDGNATRKFRLYDPPRPLKLPGEDSRLFIGLGTLAGLLGVTLDQHGAEFQLLTPEYWCGRLGLRGAAAEGRTLKNVSLLPDFGISPPAKTLILWVRPPEPAWVQIYALSDGAPRPLFGVNAFGTPITHPRPEDTPAPRKAGPGPVRVETEFYQIAGNQVGDYAAIVTREQPPGGDALKAISDGAIKDQDYCVVGLRQTVTRSPIRFELRVAREGDTLDSVASESKMPAAVLGALNGLQDGDRIEPGAKLVVIGGLDDGQVAERKRVDYVVTEMHEVQPGETIESLARRCGVSTADFMEANPGIPPGAELQQGEVVYLVRARAVPAPSTGPPARLTIKPLHALGQVKVATDIRQSTAPGAQVLRRVSPGTLVMVLGKVVGTSQFRVSIGDTVGYMTEAQMLVKNVPTSNSGTPADPQMQLVARSALQFVGTPYHWGGADLEHGIDCSHFVAAVFARGGQPVPSPPVHNMERYGKIVHWKQGPAEMFDHTVPLPQPPDLSALRPGDRIIMQNDPTRSYDGNHHTGIYLGKIDDPRFGHLEHAIVHSCSRSGVTVSDLVDSYLWRLYRFAVRGDKLRSASIVPGSSRAHRSMPRNGRVRR